MNRLKKLNVLIILIVVILSACSSSRGPNAETVEDTDNRMTDPSILSHDRLLMIGDLGLDESRAGAGQGFQALWNEQRFVQPNYSIPPLNGNYANNVINFGLNFLGTPYEYGSNRDSPATFDCSAFTRYAFLGALGMDLPKDSRSQWSYVETFGKRRYWDLSHAQRGDLLFFMGYRGFNASDYSGVNKANETITHVGIYMGDGKLLHTASQATGGVRIDTIWGRHLQWRFLRGGSVIH